MMATRAFAISMRGLLGVAACAVSSAAIAQSYSANGQISYLQEWEMKGSLAKTMTRTGTNYDGPVTLRHVGLCSTNGIEEKSGVVQLRIPPTNAGFVGTLALKDDNCQISASAGQPYTGLLSCRDGQGIPIHFTIEPVTSEPTLVTDQVGTQAENNDA
jgi:hypothetical protein